MLKQIPILLCSLLLTARCFSQFGGLVNKAKSKINQRIDRKVDQGMDQTLDNAEGKDAVCSTASPASVVAAYSKYDFIAGEKLLYAEDFAEDSAGELPAGW